MKTTFQRSIAGLLIVSMTALGMPAQAGMVSTEDSIAAKRDRVAAMLDRDDVRAQLEARGVSAADAHVRVQAMTDEEVAQVVGRVDALPAGGGDPITMMVMLPILAVGAVVLVVGAVFKGIGSLLSKSQDKSADDGRSAEEPKGTWQ